MHILVFFSFCEAFCKNSSINNWLKLLIKLNDPSERFFLEDRKTMGLNKFLKFLAILKTFKSKLKHKPGHISCEMKYIGMHFYTYTLHHWVCIKTLAYNYTLTKHRFLGKFTALIFIICNLVLARTIIIILQGSHLRHYMSRILVSERIVSTKFQSQSTDAFAIPQISTLIALISMCNI